MNPHKLLLAAAFVLQTAFAYAGCNVGALPFNLQNNTLADATQVMANFNQIVNGAASNCAADGANSDITSLSALSTPLSPAQGGSPVYAGGATTGSANAQVLTTTLPVGNPTLSAGLIVTGQWGFTNTAFLTLAVGTGGTPVAVWRSQQNGVSPTAGGEAIAGHPFVLMYNPAITAFKLVSETFIIGEMKMIASATVPPGWMVADGSSFVCANFTDLCNVLGTNFGGTTTNPLLPDTRGRVMAGFDNYSTSTGAANRLTSVGTGCGTAFNFLGASCANGNQSHTQLVAELASHNHGINDSGHTHTSQFNNTSAVWSSGINAGVSTANPGTGATVTSANNTTGITIQNQGSSQAMPIVNPNLGVVMIIRF